MKFGHRNELREASRRLRYEDKRDMAVFVACLIVCLFIGVFAS